MNRLFWAYQFTVTGLIAALLAYTWITFDLTAGTLKTTSYDSNPMTTEVVGRFHKLIEVNLTFVEYLDYLAANSSFSNTSVLLIGGDADKQMIADTFQVVLADTEKLPEIKRSFARTVILCGLLLTLIFSNLCVHIHPVPCRTAWRQKRKTLQEQDLFLTNIMHYVVYYVMGIGLLICYLVVTIIFVENNAQYSQGFMNLRVNLYRHETSTDILIDYFYNSDCVETDHDACLWNIEPFTIQDLSDIFQHAIPVRNDIHRLMDMFFGVALSSTIWIGVCETFIATQIVLSCIINGAHTYQQVSEMTSIASKIETSETSESEEKKDEVVRDASPQDSKSM